MGSYAAEEEIQGGNLTHDAACAHVSGLRLQGSEKKPMTSDRGVRDVRICDLPIRHLDESSGKVEQFADVLLAKKVSITTGCFDNIYNLCAADKYGQLPAPFGLAKLPNVPFTVQLIILPSEVPENGDRHATCFHIFKHVYLHRNKASARDCVAACLGNPMRLEWGSSPRLGLAAPNYMMDRMGGGQLRHWIIKPRFEKKLTIDQQQRAEGYQFIRDFGPKANNRNQFVEWTDEQIHMPGGKIKNWPEGKVKEALHNYMRGRQNAKTLEFRPFTLKSFMPWFLDLVLTKMIPTMRQRSITWLGRTRAGKSFGSKTALFMQSKFEIDDADRSDLIPSIVTAKNLDFFKAEPPTRFKPGVFDDGMLQKMDSSFLKAFLNPSVACIPYIKLWFNYIQRYIF